MRLIVDTNRIIAALIKDGASRKIITHLKADLITVGFGKTEIKKHKKEILKKSRISENDLDIIFGRIFSKLIVLDDQTIKPYLSEADSIMKKIDIDDAPFIAAALATGSNIWTEDKAFKKQKKVKIITTQELVDKL